MQNRKTRHVDLASAATRRDWPQQLITVLLALCMLLALLLAFLSVFERERLNAHSERYLHTASEAQILTRELSADATAAVRGDAPAFGRLRERLDELAVLHADMLAEERMAPMSAPDLERFTASAESARTSLRRDVDIILAAEPAILRFFALTADVRKRLCELGAGAQRIAEGLADEFAAPPLLLAAGLQVARAERMKSALQMVLRGGANAEESVAEGTAAADEFEVTLDAVRRDDTLSVPLRAEVEQSWTLYREMRAEADQLVATLEEVEPALAAAVTTSEDATRLHGALDGIMVAMRADSGWSALLGLRSGAESALLFAAMALVFLGLLGLQQLVRARRRARASQAQNLANQEAIERLLEEMSGLADGDLTVEARAGSEITGAIADTVNYVVTALRGLVATIKQTSAKVDDAAQRTRGSAQQLAEGSDAQARQIAQASAAISSVTGAIDSIARDAAESAAVANRSVDVAGRGAQAVGDTVAGMYEIRGRIHETSKRIRRLGDSSQEIGEIVELIDDISDQTNILALNAAMQAAMAGEAGRGFAVVADEVQRLAERSGNATKQIDAIVRAIRRDTTEAVRSMETSIAGVDSGAKVAENAGNALREIENVSNYIAELTRRIADSAGHESREAAKVNETVRSVQAITQENSRGTRATVEAVETLAGLAVELRRSVAGFKLPGGQAD